eukprot:GHVL01041071.1.p1 GENE.GHVL01041071.1~~GHVL01041071.1.p1  ORF type:complete len:861 (+),score=142.61 GHVL01041071.1:561-3143(+)
MKLKVQKFTVMMENGPIQHWGYEIEKSTITHGSIIKISCGAGFTDLVDRLDGENIYCFDGEWSEQTLSCRESCSDLYLTNMKLLKKIGDGRHGSSVTVSCQEGYTSNRFSRFYNEKTDVTDVNEKIYCLNGQWEKSGLNCRANCPMYPLPGPEYRVVGSGIHNGSKRQIMCTSGYSGVGSTIYCQDGVWQSYHTLCKKDCSMPKYLGKSYSITSITDGVHDGSIITVSCSSGYGIQNGNKETDDYIVCEDGEWTNLTLTCSLNCLPPQIAPGVIMTGDGLSPHAVRSLDCEQQFHSEIYPMNITCIRGEWSVIGGTCNRSCGDIQISEGLEISSEKYQIGEAHHHGTEISFKCKHGWIATNDKTTNEKSVCIDGKWTIIPIICTRPCEAFPELGPSYIVSSADSTHGASSADSTHGATRTVSCAPGFSSTRGGSHTSLVCAWGHWEGVVNDQLPTFHCSKNCRDFIFEISEFPYPGGEAYVVDHTLGGVHHGSQYTVRCADGYTSITGVENEIRKCSFGEWTVATLNCQPLCVHPMQYNSLFPELYQVQTFGNLQHGDFAIVTCTNNTIADAGYSPEVAMCHYGFWQERWLSCRPNVFFRWTNSYKYIASNKGGMESSQSPISIWRPVERGSFKPLGDMAYPSLVLPGYKTRPMALLVDVRGDVKHPDKMIGGYKNIGETSIDFYQDISFSVTEPVNYVCLGMAAKSGWSNTKPSFDSFGCLSEACTIPQTNSKGSSLQPHLLHANKGSRFRDDETAYKNMCGTGGVSQNNEGVDSEDQKSKVCSLEWKPWSVWLGGLDTLYLTKTSNTTDETDDVYSNPPSKSSFAMVKIHPKCGLLHDPQGLSLDPETCSKNKSIFSH